MPVGQIVKAVSGFYYVRTSEGDTLQCRARGVFKFEKKKLTPLVGDWVEYEKIGVDEGVVTQVHPRKNELLRPPIANVEQVIVVCSLRQPRFQQMPVDRLLVHAEREGLDIVIVLTKKDLIHSEEEVETIYQIYQAAGYPVLTTSIRTMEGIEELKEHLAGKTTVFAGQSGVGKSSLLNQICPEFQLQTSSVSQKIGRGRHTTRTVELLSLPFGGQVADTPGFSQLSFQDFDKNELSDCFPEFRERSEHCRFRACLHLNEPDCAVKEALSQGLIHSERYKHYKLFIAEIEQVTMRRY